MSDTASALGFDAALFTESFATLRPLIRQEWPAVEEEALEATAGDAQKVVALIAERTERSQVRIRHTLADLVDFAGVETVPAEKAGLEGRLLDVLQRLEKHVEPVQAQARQQAQQLRERGQHLAEDMRAAVPQAEEKLKENFWTTLLAALGLGVILGLLMGGGRGR